MWKMNTHFIFLDYHSGILTSENLEKAKFLEDQRQDVFFLMRSYIINLNLEMTRGEVLHNQMI